MNHVSMMMINWQRGGKLMIYNLMIVVDNHDDVVDSDNDVDMDKYIIDDDDDDHDDDDDVLN